MRRWIAAFAILLLPAVVQGGSGELALDVQGLMERIRDGVGSAQERQGRLEALLVELRRVVPALEGMGGPAPRRVVPVVGARRSDVGGQGKGFRPEGYSFMDGDLHRGHPAHDIFVHDRDQDGLDDRTKAPVAVVSWGRGLVVQARRGWDPAQDSTRGGNTVYVYDPDLPGLIYYAHLGEVLVRAGDKVVPGQAIGTVGRTGRRAVPGRSPTHIHLMMLELHGQGLRPYDPWPLMSTMLER